MLRLIFEYAIIIMFILLWGYASLPKLFNMKYFREVLDSQAIPKWINPYLTWLLPITEIVVMILLIFPSTRIIGMYGSLILMFIFTLYVSGIIIRIYDIYPCPCGGLFTRLGWKRHFKINIVLTLVAIIGIALISNWI